MTVATKMAMTERTSSRWDSLLLTLRRFSEALDPDPQMEVYTSMNKLVEAVSRLEARLAVLEPREGNSSAAAISGCPSNCQ
jgi:hypothetical protein